ncbi:MAG TPA: elongation factor P [Alphaproteobacteria bacterium]
MPKVNAITLRYGHVIEYEGKLWVVVKAEINQPGKGAAVMQIEMRDIRAGTKTNVRFRTQETLERVRLEQADCTFLYADGDDYHFMNTETFEQMTVKAETIGEQSRFLQENMAVEVESFEGEVLGVTLPDQATFTIVEADPVVKGQTASSSYKPAILDNGVRVMVPPHIESGTRIVIKTEDGSYVERAKD